MAAVVMTGQAAFAACVGDCSGSRTVKVSDLIRGVNIALGNSAVTGCGALDANGNGVVSIAELVSAVSNALLGCDFVSPTPTRTATPGPPTQTFTATQAQPPTSTPTVSIIPPGLDSRMLGTWSGTARNEKGDSKTVTIKIEVASNKVKVTDVGGNLFTASGKKSIEMTAAQPTILSYNTAKPPNYIEIFQIGTLPVGNQPIQSIAGQYTVTNFSFPPTGTSFAMELRPQG
ncbi:MAG: hypothetical protein ACRERC_04175 [Candidatus Binatia bacterium]